MFVLGADLSPDQDVAQGRGEGDGEDRRDEHHEGLGVGERLEEAPRLAGQGEDRQEGDGDDEQREEDGRGHLTRRFGQELVAIGARRGVLELLVRGLDHDDLRVDRRADGDGDAAETHDGGWDVEQVHRV